MQATNVKLSAAEMALACNSEVLLTKNRIIEKVYVLFGELSANYLQLINNYKLPAEILAASPKISRGENYLGLPWVMLDYPRYFKESDFFFVRTFFWWGNYFSMAMLLKGSCLALVNVEKLIKQSAGKSWFISTINDPWKHHISVENTLLVEKMDVSAIENIIEKTGFLKLQVKIEIGYWDDVQGFMEDRISDFMQLVKE